MFVGTSSMPTNNDVYEFILSCTNNIWKERFLREDLSIFFNLQNIYFKNMIITLKIQPNRSKQMS